MRCKHSVLLGVTCSNRPRRVWSRWVSRRQVEKWERVNTCAIVDTIVDTIVDAIVGAIVSARTCVIFYRILWAGGHAIVHAIVRPEIT